MMEIEKLEGKQIYVQLNSGRIYSGLVLEVTYVGRIDDIEVFLITIKDKYNFLVSFSSKEIKVLEEER